MKFSIAAEGAARSVTVVVPPIAAVFVIAIAAVIAIATVIAIQVPLCRKVYVNEPKIAAR
jgi:hypothetical protein